MNVIMSLEELIQSLLRTAGAVGARAGGPSCPQPGHAFHFSRPPAKGKAEALSSGRDPGLGASRPAPVQVRERQVLLPVIFLESVVARPDVISDRAHRRLVERWQSKGVRYPFNI